MGFIQTDDGVRLFHRDWSNWESARPILPAFIQHQH